MTNERISTAPTGAQLPCHSWRVLSMAVLLVAAFQFLTSPARGQGRGYNDEDAEVLTRGPVHEAFATVVDYNPGRGLVTRQRPPDPIEELPPEERPVGDNVAWIPGYWAWDDEQSDYIWVSGTWRVPPPGREWVPGYWADSQGEFIWISGYWAEIEVRQATYLPPPPTSLERGPNIDRPSLDYGWTPGCWVWQHGDYAWRPGYWARGRGDWIWIPAYYVWTPHGYIFIDGYWDYVVARRGIVYAPVRFRSRSYVRTGYYYSPSIVFNLGIFSDHLFLRPSYCHYYFGDYYASRYESAGFYFSFTYYSSWRGYDPFYSHWRWEHRHDRDWDRRYRDSYHYRREHEMARPPSTWSAQVAVYSSTTTTTSTNRIIVAGTTTQLASTSEFKTKFRKVDEGERRNWGERGRQVRTSREERRNLEVRTAESPSRGDGRSARPVQIERPKSAIASKPVRQLPREFVPPSAPKTPAPDARARQPSAGQASRGDSPSSRGNAQPERGRGADRREERPPQARERESRDGTARGQDAVRAEPRGDGRREREAQAQSERQSQRQSDSTQERRRAEAAEARTNRGAQANQQAKERAEAQRKIEQQAAERERAAKANEQKQARERAPEARKKQDLQSTERRAKEAEARANREAQTRERREAAERERAAKANEQKQARERAAEARKKQELQAAERRAKEAEARANREAQARERREAAERAKADEARARAEASRRAKEENAQRSKPAQKKGKQSSGAEDEESQKEEKKNGRP